MFPMMALVSKYIYLALLTLFTSTGLYLYLRKPSAAICKEVYAYQVVVLIVFNALSFLLIVMNAQNASKASAAALEAQNAASSNLLGPLMDIFPSWVTESMLITIGLYALVMILMYVLLLTVYRHTNRLLWNCVYMLLSVGFVVLYRLDPSVCRTQVYWIIVGFIVCNVVMLVFRGRWIWKIPAWVYLVISVGLIAMPFVFPNPAYGSLNWVQIGPVSFQPSEFVKLTFAFFLAVLYTHKRKLVSVAEAGAVTLVMALILLKQNDLGALLIFGILAWLMTFDFTERFYVLWSGAVLVVLAGYAAYHLVSHVQVRFDIWFDPWKDVNGQGYQIAQSLFAIVNGGWFGKGLYQGIPEYIPVNTTDMVFSVIMEEFGAAFGIVLLMTFLLMFLFVIETGRRERNTIRRNLLIAFGVLFISQTFIIVGGVIKFLPLTGVTLPFVSYGGSSLLSNFITIAIIEAVIRLYRIDKEEVRKRERQKQQELEWQQSQFRREQTAPVKPSAEKTGRRKQKGIKPFEFDDPF